MINLPMFHSGGVMPVTAMLIHGGSIAMVDAFDTDTFWPTIRQAQITTVILLGVMGGFLLKRPPSPTTGTTRCAPAPMCRSTTPRRSSMSASAPTSTPIST
jgi:acyl-CoA synthetase (AMP-forming)/AMP-acid ligase II